ncbi:MAG: cell division protein ZapB [Sulfolobaceae archaeon]|nr:cell division protein ZapB [Sulfolobaceae archaeon]
MSSKSYLVIGVVIGLIIGGLLGGLLVPYLGIANNTSEANKISQLQSQISQLESQTSNLQAQNSQLQGEINSLKSENSQLQAQVSQLQSIISLSDSETLVSEQTVSEPAGQTYEWGFSLSYPGYLIVTVQSSTTTKTYVEVVWNYNGVSYSNTINVGSGGTAEFPVLPTTVYVYVGNNNFFNGATETVSITYVY